MCSTNDGIEDVEHFLVLCPAFDIQRRDRLTGVSEFLRPVVQIDTLSNNVLVQYLLYGNKELSNDLNKNTIEKTLNFTHKTCRFGRHRILFFLFLFYTTQPPCTLFPISFVNPFHI